jgi:AcrR family transcriptional regulator
VPTTRTLDPELTERIAAATLELLAERGFRELRLDDIAAHVGTSKQALYRRFATKSELVAQALRSLAASTTSANPPRTGSLRRDLVAVLGASARNLSRTALGAALRALVGEATDRVLASAVAEIEESRRSLVRAVLVAGRGRGELAAARDLELDVDLLLGAIYIRTLVRRQPPDRGFAERVVDTFLDGAAAKTLGERGPPGPIPRPSR